LALDHEWFLIMSQCTCRPESIAILEVDLEEHGPSERISMCRVEIFRASRLSARLAINDKMRTWKGEVEVLRASFSPGPQLRWQVPHRASDLLLWPNYGDRKQSFYGICAAGPSRKLFGTHPIERPPSRLAGRRCGQGTTGTTTVVRHERHIPCIMFQHYA